MTPRPGGFWSEKTNTHPIPDPYKRERRAGWFFVILGAALFVVMVVG